MACGHTGTGLMESKQMNGFEKFREKYPNMVGVIPTIETEFDGAVYLQKHHEDGCVTFIDVTVEDERDSK